jgi:hypothetical protein
MSKEPIKNYGLTETQLPPHLRPRAGGRPGGGASNTAISEKTLEAGEDFAKGCALWFGADKKLYKASNTASDNKPCVAIALQDATSGQQARYAIADRITGIAGANLTPGAAVFLMAESGGLNIGAGAPDFAPGKLFQILGRADSAESFWIGIEGAAEAL